LLFPDSAERMNWKYWLAGLSLWLLGFASVVGWLLLRWPGQAVQGCPTTSFGLVGPAVAKEGSHLRRERKPPPK
jgi:hypothetical protein